MDSNILTPIIIKNLGLKPYLETYQMMVDFTNNRTENTPDEIWFVEHPSTFTQGKVGKSEHILIQSNIPIIQTNRGGQITYHAPGQQIMYVLFDLKRLNKTVKQIVKSLENCVINTLSFYNIKGNILADKPGVYIDQKKICSLGLNINKGCTLHGLAFNIDMDLSPFDMINPCGYAGMEMTKLSDYTQIFNFDEIRKMLSTYFIEQLKTT